MAIKDLLTGTTHSILHEAKALTSATDGASVDTKGTDSLTVTLNAGIFSGTTPTADWLLQDSDDDSTFATVAASGLIGSIPQITDANDQTVYAIGYRGIRRYVRLRLNATGGSSPSLLCSVTAIVGVSRH